VRTGTRRALDEVAALVLPVVMPVVRRLPTVVIGLATMLTVLGGLVLIGAARDDAAITERSAVTTAEVLEGSGFSRTLVRFTTVDGQVVVPEFGVFYPVGLQPGDVVAVEYDTADPDRVRVLGRDASLGFLPILLGAVAVWTVALPLAWWLRRRQRRRAADRARARAVSRASSAD